MLKIIRLAMDRNLRNFTSSSQLTNNSNCHRLEGKIAVVTASTHG